MPTGETGEINFAAIQFPTDQVTLGRLRGIDPEFFTARGIFGAHASDLGILATLVWEQTLAQKAFAAAGGQPDPFPDNDRRELILAINADYLQYGLSGGLQQTYQLVRAFEKAAASQVRHTAGRAR